MSEDQLASTLPLQLLQAAEAVSNRLDADVILFNQDIDEYTAANFHARLDSIPPAREAVFLVLVTNGGDAHAAYIIARELQLRYHKVILCIAGDCYSAGTLIVCCAHELVITPRGRLGPLDVQIPKKDELYERLSGLTASDALDELSDKAFQTFASMAYQLKRAFGWQLSFRTAMDVAATMTAQMFGEVYKQIDPIRLGEDARALKIAAHYATMLNRASKNLRLGAVERLTKGYPSHQCIIDATEASELFVNSRPPGKEEAELLNLLGPVATDAAEGDSAFVYVFPQTAEEGASDGRRHEHPQPKNQIPNGHKASGKPGNPPVPERGGGPPGEGSRAAEDS